MKNLIISSLVAAAALTMTGCAAHPGAGALFVDQSAPVTATANSKSTKTGISEECTSILGLVAMGDCTIENAKKNGGITAVTSVDTKRSNILGIIHTGKTVVTGN